MSTDRQPLPAVRVGEPSPALAAAVAAVVNPVYDDTEGAVWVDGVQRTSPDEALTLLEAGAVLVALDDAQDPTSLLGAVCVKQREARTADFGMLAVSPAAAGRGLGTALVRAAEQHARAAGAERMEIVVLRPESGTLPAKEILGRWYPRLGYTLTGTAPVDRAALPTMDLLNQPCLLDTYVRDLTSDSPQEHV